MDVVPGRDDVVFAWLDPPVMAEIRAGSIVLFDGGDAGRVLWRKPEEAARILQAPGCCLEGAPRAGDHDRASQDGVGVLPGL
jgi:hypothetical protein